MSNQAEQTLKIFEGAESARAHNRALQAYQHEDHAIAIWELRHLAEIQAGEVRQQSVSTNESKAALVITEHGSPNCITSRVEGPRRSQTRRRPLRCSDLFRAPILL